MSRRAGRALMRSRIVGTGSYLPERILTNRDLRVDGGDHRRVDRLAHRHPRAPHRRRGRDDERPGARGLPARAGGRRAAPRRHRPHRARDLHAGHGVPVERLPAAEEARASATAPPSTCRRCARASSTRSPRPTSSSAPACTSARSSSARRCSRASSTGRTAAPACSSATAPAPWCSRPRDEPGHPLGAPARRRRLRRHPQHARPRRRRQGPGRPHAQDGRRRGVQARRARARGERARGARGQRPRGRRRRLVRRAPGQRAHHFPHREEAGHPAGEVRRDGGPRTPTPPPPPSRSPWTSRCATAASSAATSCSWRAWAAASRGVPFSSGGERNDEDRGGLSRARARSRWA